MSEQFLALLKNVPHPIYFLPAPFVSAWMIFRDTSPCANCLLFLSVAVHAQREMNASPPAHIVQERGEAAAAVLRAR